MGTFIARYPPRPRAWFWRYRLMTINAKALRDLLGWRGGSMSWLESRKLHLDMRRDYERRNGLRPWDPNKGD